MITEINDIEQCKCYPEHSSYLTYCPVHDGDYGKWKWGENYGDYDESPDDPPREVDPPSEDTD